MWICPTVNIRLILLDESTFPIIERYISYWTSDLINLRGQDEITLREPVDLVGPYRDAGLAPGEIDIRMVTLLFRNSPHLVHKIESTIEIRKSKFPLDVMIVHDVPLFHLRCQWLDFIGRQWRNSAAARNAGFLRQSHVLNLRSAA